MIPPSRRRLPRPPLVPVCRAPVQRLPRPLFPDTLSRSGERPCPRCAPCLPRLLSPRVCRGPDQRYPRCPPSLRRCNSHSPPRPILSRPARPPRLPLLRVVPPRHSAPPRMIPFRARSLRLGPVVGRAPPRSVVAGHRLDRKPPASGQDPGPGIISMPPAGPSPQHRSRCLDRQCTPPALPLYFHTGSTPQLRSSTLPPNPPSSMLRNVYPSDCPVRAAWGTILAVRSRTSMGGISPLPSKASTAPKTPC